MSDTIVLLEDKKETTTFLLDEGTGTETRVVTGTGEQLATVYSDPIGVDDVVSISDKSEIGAHAVKKYEDGDIILGIAINEPLNNSNRGMRETGVLVLGQLFRLKLAEGQTNISVKDRISLSENGAIADTSGLYVALHAVEDQADYEYLDVVKPFAFP